MRTRMITRTACLAIALVCIGGTAHANQSEAEQFQRLAAMENSPQAIHTSTSVNPGRNILTPGLDRTAFERELSERFMGTHLLYQKLSDEDRNKVYTFYQDNNQIDSVRRKVAYSL